MLYFLAIIAPPFAVAATGRPFLALLNVPLTIAGWLPGVLHAVLVVHDHKADERAERYGLRD